MDQMLGATGGTTSMDNFSETQIDLLENTLLKYSGDHTGDTNFAYDKCVDNITFGFKSGEEPVYRGEQIVAGEDKSIEFERGSYSVVEFDYKIISESGTTFSFALLDTESSGWSSFYGLFAVSASGGNFSGMTFSTLSDGHIHVTINVSQLTKSGNLNDLNSAPEAFNIIFIRGSLSTATAYIDNVKVTL